MKLPGVILSAAGVIAVCAVWLLSGGEERDGEPVSVGGWKKVSLRLANRMIEVDGADAPVFPEKPVLGESVRGTSAFVLAVPGGATKDARSRAEACGARVLGVAAPHGMFVEADAEALRNLRKDGAFAAAFEMTPADKIAGSLAEKITVMGADEIVPVTVLALRPEDADGITDFLSRSGITPREAVPAGKGKITACVNREMLKKLSVRGDVRWIERHYQARLMNDVAVGEGLMNVDVVRDTYGLDGEGQTITCSDTGLDTGNASTMMADFTGRVGVVRTVSGAYSCDKSGHGTHVAGSLAGSGELSGEGRPLKGMAPKAVLNVWQCQKSDGYLYFPSSLDSLFRPSHYLYPSYIHSGSWGMNETAEYTTFCANVDEWFWNNPENLGVFSAGNSGGVGTICDPGGAKNVLCVGGTETYRKDMGSRADNPSSIAWFSSKGPMKDGRVKPDVCAPGTYILSTFSSVARAGGVTNLKWSTYSSNSNYTYCGGTSMSTPLVAGASALVRQWLIGRKGYTNSMPTAALMKAVITGGAHDMSADSGADCGGAAPNDYQGWGRMNLGESLYPVGLNVRLVDRIPFSDGSDHSLRVTVTNSAPLDVQLVWTDHPGDVAAAQALVNDLDLVVSNETTGAVWYGNGIVGGDHTNNVESVRIASAETGTYSISVKGVSVLYDSTEGGAAALYARGAIKDEAENTDDAVVTLTVNADGDEIGEVYPLAGSHRFTKGTTVKLEAGDWSAPSNSCGTVSVKRHVAGWTGSGDVPVTGADASVTVTLNHDSSISWKWAEKRNLLLRRYLLVTSYGPYYLECDESWPQEGEEIPLSVPQSIPGGTDYVDLSGYDLEYTDDDGSVKPMAIQRLGRVEIVETDSEEGYAVTGASGYMAETFTVAMDTPKDVLFHFWDEASTNAASNLPTWWYYRYVADNPFADEIRFTSVSPMLLEWTGGAAHRRVLERSEKLGEDADWKAVFVNEPEAVLTNRWQVPDEYSADSFYRVKTVD